MNSETRLKAALANRKPERAVYEPPTWRELAMADVLDSAFAMIDAMIKRVHQLEQWQASVKYKDDSA